MEFQVEVDLPVVAFLAADFREEVVLPAVAFRVADSRADQEAAISVAVAAIGVVVIVVVAIAAAGDLATRARCFPGPMRTPTE